MNSLEMGGDIALATWTSGGSTDPPLSPNRLDDEVLICLPIGRWDGTACKCTNGCSLVQPLVLLYLHARVSQKS